MRSNTFLRIGKLAIALIPCLAATPLIAATYTVAQDGTGDYLEVADAVDEATCGDTVRVQPGVYDEVEILDTAAYPKDCRGSAPLVIEAVNPAVDLWDAEPGAGALSSACVTGANPWDLECDRATVSYVPRFFGDDADSLGNLHIRGFETHYIGFSGKTGLGTTGCAECVIERNFFNVFFKRCLQLVDSDDTVVRGNRLYRCGGDDSGDQDIGGARSQRQEIHHNDLYGSGYPNGLGLTGTCTDWELCKDDFQGTDGWTVSDADQCGFHFHHNRVHHHSGRGNHPPDDGDAIDLKHLDCAADPVHLYNNEIHDNGGVAQVIFHNSARGVRFYNNRVADGARFGIYFQAGQKCPDTTLPGMSSYRIFNNEILRNGEDGLYIGHLNKCTVGSVTYERTDTHDIKVFNNLFKDNVEAGLAVHWITDDGVARGSGLPLTHKAWVIANNIFIDNYAGSAATGQHYQVIFKDSFSAIRLEDYFTFANNFVTGPLYFDRSGTGTAYPDVGSFDAAGYGYDNFNHAPRFVDPASDDYRLLPPTVFDQGLDFADILTDPSDYASLPITDRGGAPRPERKMNDIGPWEWCPDDDGDGLGVCIDPQEGLPNRWYFINADLSSLVLPAAGHVFRHGFSEAPVLWRGTHLRFGRQVRVDGVVDESKAHPVVYDSVAGVPHRYGLAVELR